MQGPSHLMVSWFFAEAAEVDSARDRRIVAWAGFMPDIDVLAYLGALAWYRLDKELAFENVWKEVHHRYTHNLAFALLVGAVAYAMASRGDARHRARVAVLAAAACALHCFLDLVGAGPTWPIYPLWPFSNAGWHATWSWTIGDWPNIVIFVGLVLGMFAYARVRGRSPMESFGGRVDAWFVRVVREGRDTPAAGDAAASSRRRWLIWGGLVLLVIAVLAPLGFNPFE